MRHLRHTHGRRSPIRHHQASAGRYEHVAGRGLDRTTQCGWATRAHGNRPSRVRSVLMRPMARTVAAAWWLAVFIGGVPAALIVLVGWPLPDHWPTEAEWAAFVVQPLTKTSMIDGFALLLWALWALFIL